MHILLVYVTVTYQAMLKQTSICYQLSGQWLVELEITILLSIILQQWMNSKLTIYFLS